MIRVRSRYLRNESLTLDKAYFVDGEGYIVGATEETAAEARKIPGYEITVTPDEPDVATETVSGQGVKAHVPPVVAEEPPAPPPFVEPDDPFPPHVLEPEEPPAVVKRKPGRPPKAR